MNYSGQLTIDSDWTEHGWEIAIRASAESMETAWSGLDDHSLAQAIGQEAAAFFIGERDAHSPCLPD